MKRKTHWLAIGIGALGPLVWSSVASAQLHEEQGVSLLNYLGRFHGVGYSNGYHACPTNKGCSNPQLRSNSSISQLHSQPSGEPYAGYSSPLFVNDPWIHPMQPIGGNFHNGSGYSPQPMAPSQPVTPPAAVHPQFPRNAPGESVRPVPWNGTGSPSDNNPRMRAPANPLPAPTPQTPQNNSGSTLWLSPSYPVDQSYSYHHANPNGASPQNSLLRQSYAPGYPARR